MLVAIVTIAFNDVSAIKIMVAPWRHSDSNSLSMITLLMFKSAIATWRLAWEFDICLSVLCFWEFSLRQLSVVCLPHD
jgi:hypothetical protein